MAACAACADISASVVHQDVDVPKTFDGLADNARDVFRDGQISDDPQRFHSVLGADISGSLGQRGAGDAPRSPKVDRRRQERRV